MLRARGFELGGLTDWDKRESGMESEVTNIERSEEHTSELQSRLHLVCRLLLEKKKKQQAQPWQVLGSKEEPRSDHVDQDYVGSDSVSAPMGLNNDGECALARDAAIASVRETTR